MKINFRKLFKLHKWEYNESGVFRKCVYCSTQEVCTFDEGKWIEFEQRDVMYSKEKLVYLLGKLEVTKDYEYRIGRVDII